MFSGMFTALITPFSGPSTYDAPIDMEGLEELIEWQISSGVDGFVLLGTTAESATLTLEERIKIVRRSKEIIKERVPIIVGTGTNSTKVSIEYTKAIKEIGADGVLAVSPYYNKPQQEGMFYHFSSIAAEGGLPLVLYNVPSRTSSTISTDLFKRLSKVSGIVGVKQASDSADALISLFRAVEGRLDVFAGDDALTYLVMALGGKGVISASANVIPREMKEIVSLSLENKMKEARKAQYKAYPIIKSLFSETNPAPAKAALKLIGKLKEDTHRLPLVEASTNTVKLLKEVIERENVHA